MAAYSESLLLCLCLMGVYFSGVTAKRIKEKIYIDLVSQNACFRILNGTHQSGCGSEQEGNTGVVHYMQTQEDWDFVLKTGSTTPYVPILDAVNFTSHNVRQLAFSGRVNGIGVISVNLTSDDLPQGFSADKSCPNDAYGLYKGTEYGSCEKVTWNPPGEGLLFEDLGVPIFSFTEQSDVDTILQKCWAPFNKAINDTARSYPLCAIQLVAAMAAAKDAETCVRRSNLITNLNPIAYCDPLGDKNVMVTLKAVPSNETRPEKSVIVMAARMDSMSMFFNEYPSANTTVTGIVAMLAAAKALWKLQDTISSTPNSKDVMFTFFQGEAFDYIGSSRVLYEMQGGRFPVDFSDSDTNTNLQKINLTHIDQFVELSQVGMREDEDSLWLHVDPGVRRNTEVQRSLEKLQEFGNQSSTRFQNTDADTPLPPASVQRFLKEAENASLPSFVITDHKASFTNRYYNSRLDLTQIEDDYPSGLNDSEKYNANTTQSEHITALATALARYLFWAATNTTPDASQMAQLQADIEEVNHMLYCFLLSPHCELFNYTISPDNADALNKNKKPFPFYVSVHQNTNQVTSLVQRVLAYLTGQEVANTTQEDCTASGSDKRYSYIWMQGEMVAPGGPRRGVCYRSTVFTSKAKSPAFDIDDYDWKSGKYSTWTESRWENFKVRVFLIPSKQFQVLTLTVGVAFLLISFVVIYFISSSADVLFQSSALE